MTANNLKLGVDVTSAHNLMAKDGKGSSSAYVELCFDGQRYRTTVKDKDLNPVWDESFYFNISDPFVLQHLSLEAYVYSSIRGTDVRTFLGKVSISGTSFVPHSDAVVLHYPLEKRGIFSRVRGEIGLKVYITNDSSIKSSVPVPSMENSREHAPVEARDSHGRSDRHSFHHLPNPNTSQRHHHDNAPVPEVQHHSNKYEVEEMRAEVMNLECR